MQNINLIVRLSLKDAILAGLDAWGDELVPLQPSKMTGKQRIALASLPLEYNTNGLITPVLAVAYPAKPDEIPGLLDRLSSPNMEDIADPEPLSMDPEPLSMDPEPLSMDSESVSADVDPESDTDD